nr:PREDICTED: ubiquitin carboxyl-terminal hydrolase 16 isoform X2 [Latimeria chalumnae]|eukprot:XP_014351696.1 PREDICTED: ubiquitin carboxyl-terminal hydrolase 16 isoform X2 [Latimeria chalumnae]
MGKRKGKGKSSQADDDTDTFDQNCRHIRKGLDQNQLKKALVEVKWNVCQSCKTEKTPAEETDESPPIWLCLKCGHQGCGRSCEEQHAVKHYETLRSEPHCLVLGLDCWNVWCYICDKDVQYHTKGQLGQLVEYVRKRAIIESPEKSSELKEKDVEDLVSKKAEKETQNEKKKENKDGKVKKEEKGSTPVKNDTALTVKGLSNLGNTCFFNAVMQNLLQTYILRDLLKEVRTTETTIKITPPDSNLLEESVVNLEQPGPLTSTMCQFLKETQETKKGTVTPKELFSQVCKKAVRFKGYQQQDSHELLRYLLDGMRTEEIKRVVKGMLKSCNNSPEKLEEEELEKRLKEYEKRGAVPNFVDQLFGGELTSTVRCEECKTVTLVTEKFLDLSLPVLDEQVDKKKTTARSRKVSSEGEEEDYGSYVKDRNEVSSGTSKHQQKKAKKQAKKQSKNQRKQQKLQEKVLPLGTFTATQQQSEGKDDLLEEASSLRDQCEKNGTEEEEEEESLNLTQSENPQIHQETSVSNQEVSENGETSSGTSREVENEEMSSGTSAMLASTTCILNQFNSLSIEDDGGEEEKEVVNGLTKLNLDDAVLDLELEGSLEEDKDEKEECILAKEYQVVSEDPETAFSPLSNRETVNTQECSIETSLFQFTQPESLNGINKLLCNVCTQKQHRGSKASGNGEKKKAYTNAQKQMLISLAPPVLTLHLKRFQQAGFNLRKVNKYVQFPQQLDVAPFCTVKCKNVGEGDKGVLYNLYGIVEHTGTMRSGHYTAYVKVRAPSSHLSDHILTGTIPQATKAEAPRGSWFHVSDTHVQPVPETKVVNSQAYLLFYERTF